MQFLEDVVQTVGKNNVKNVKMDAFTEIHFNKINCSRK